MSTLHTIHCACPSCESRRKRRENLIPKTIPNVLPCAPGENCTLAQLEAYHIKLVLEKSRTIDEAANTLGIDHATLYRKRRRANG
jgi:transcriptional regulator with PAS, ATPase and Fis domain